MAGTVNKVILIGRIGSDPIIKYSSSGDAIANFSLATDEPQKQDDGSWGTRPEWHKCTCFKKTAEIVGSYCKKGSLIYAEGKLQTRQWEDKEGQKRYSTEVVVKEIALLGGKQDGKESTEQSDHDKAKANGYQRDQPQQQKPAGGTTSGTGGQSGMPAGGDVDDLDQIPF